MLVSMKLDFSRDSQYHTQRNNALIPLESCNTTSLVMALKQAGWDLPHPEGMQPEDYLTSRLQSDESLERMRSITPWAFDADGTVLYPPNEVHAMLRLAVNQWAGRDIDTFRTDWDLDELLGSLSRGCGIVLSGIFRVNGRVLNHMVSLAGFYSDLSGYIIDDPFGDYRTGYADHHGNNVVVSHDDFMRIFKITGSRSKWAHVIAPAPEGEENESTA